MITYLSSMLMSLFIINRSQKVNQVITGVFMAAIILSFVAGLRSNTVGSDTNIYYNFYSIAKNSSSFFSYRDFYSNVEVGYLFLNWLAVKIGLSWNGLLFIINFFTNITAFLSIYYLRNHINVFVAITIYIFDFWPYSLNIMRQSLSMSIVLLAVCCFINKRPKLTIFILISSLFFHKSSILFIMVFVLCLIFLKFMKQLLVANLIIIFLGGVLLTLRYPLLNVVKAFGLLDEKYNDYFISYGINSGLSYLNFLFLFIPFFIFYVSAKKCGMFREKNMYLITVIFLVGIIMNLLTRVNYIFFYRTALFLVIMQVFFYSFVLKKEVENKNSLFIFIIMYSIFGFFVRFVFGNYGDIFPYISIF